MLVLQWNKITKLTILFLIIAYIAHVPLPEELTTDRRPLQFVFTCVRLFCLYPREALRKLGLTYVETKWLRFAFKSFSYLSGLSAYSEGGVQEIWDAHFSNVPVSVYVPEKRKNDGAIVFIHGGGFVYLDVASYEHLVYELVRKTGMLVISIEYRLAPEHVFPVALNDCQNALVSFLTEQYEKYQVDPTKVVLMGDSAGGNLAAVIALRLRNNRNVPRLKLQVLIYPMIQFVDLLTPSYQLSTHLTEGTGMLDGRSLARLYLFYIGFDPNLDSELLKNNHTTLEVRSSVHFKYLDHRILPEKYKRNGFYNHPEKSTGSTDLFRQLEPFMFNPVVSPIMSTSLSGLPKSLVVTCEYDPLRDEGYWYFHRMKNEGVDVQLLHYDEGFHAMLNMYTVTKVGRKALDDISDFILKNINP